MIIGSIIGLLLSLFIFYSFVSGSQFYWQDLLIPISGVIGGAVIGTIVISIPATEITSDTVIISHNIVSMKDGTSTEGSFFLGSGVIGNKPSFTYYEQDASGAVRLKHVNANDASVVQYDGPPKVTEECDSYKDSPTLWTWPIGDIWAEDDIDCWGENIVFYVPEGSVKTDFVLDAE